MIEINVTLGQDAFEHGHYVYVWLDERGIPFYVGETGKSPADRIGLHIRDVSRSGAVVSRIIQENQNPPQQYTVLAFAIGQNLLNEVVAENGAGRSLASYNRARKALERSVYDILIIQYQNIYQARGCRWSANSGNDFAHEILASCQDREVHEA